MRSTTLRALLPALLLLTGPDPSAIASEPARGCWTKPAPDSLEEVGIVSSNAQARAARQQETRRRLEPAVLTLSDGDMKIAYGAGLVVGWAETGYRPQLSTVLAVGKSALIAPFAFIGAGGDALIADLFNCRTQGWPALADHAAALLDRPVLDKIAGRHAAGARLLVGLPGSPVRGETVWDLGMVAASGGPAAQRQIAAILHAAVDPTVPIDPSHFSTGGRTIVRSWTFRKLGAGEPFLSAPDPGAASPTRAYFAIHNGVLFPDESDTFVSAERADRIQSLNDGQARLVHALDFVLLAEEGKAAFHFASVRPGLNLTAVEHYDPLDMRDLFRIGFRQGRMMKAWKDALPSERDGKARSQSQ